MSQYKSKFQNTEVFYICVCICVGIGKVILFQLLSLKKWETDTCTCNMMQYLKKKQFCNKCLPVPWFVSAKQFMERQKIKISIMYNIINLCYRNKNICLLVVGITFTNKSTCLLYIFCGNQNSHLSLPVLRSLYYKLGFSSVKQRSVLKHNACDWLSLFCILIRIKGKRYN